jgi:threonine dehydratase
MEPTFATTIRPKEKGEYFELTAPEKPRASIKEVRDAEERIREFILKTPLVRSTYLSENAKAEFYLKLENLQVTGSFKIRGALNKLAQTASRPESKNGIITASAGNHGQAVALCASKLRLRAKIIVPENTPKMKIDKIRQYGAEVVLHGAIFDQAEQYAKELAAKDSLSYVSAYNDELVIAGHGTIALEILQQAPDIETILVPVGGGGLISGIGVAAKSMRPSIQIIGVQSEASPSMYESLRAKHLVEAKVKDSIAEGLSGNIEAGSITFDFASKYVDRILLVKEDTIKKAIRVLWEKDGQISEGSGAASTAAVLENKDLFAGKKVAAILSGGNIDPMLFKSIVE